MIYVLGSVNMDLIATTDRLPLPGETLAGHGFTTAPGGKGANQALAAARASSENNHVAMIGAVGMDEFAQASLAMLKEAGADLSNIKQVEGPTGTALILVGGDGENMIIVVPGANGTLTSFEAEDAIGNMSEGDYLLLQMEISEKATKTALLKAREKGIVTLFNIAPATAEAIALAGLPDVLVANETEFDLLIGKGTLSEQDRQIEMLARHEKLGQTIIITLGGDGVIAAHEKQSYSVQGLQITPVDTVGAGDTFCGYLADGLHSNLNFEDALRRAAVAGSLACLTPGAQPSIPTRSEVSRALEV